MPRDDLGSADTNVASADTNVADVASAQTQAAPRTPDSGDLTADAFVRAPTTASGTAATSPAIPILLPIVARDNYEILGEHDRGGLGRILRARDRRTGRVVAIKEVLRASDETAARFQREALVTANLQHPAIVPVYEVGRWPDGHPFYAMKLVSGRSLADAIKLAPERADRLALLPHVIAAADALAYAHDRGFIHRDLKPSNVLVGAFGETVVIDWGLAKDLHHGEPEAVPRRRSGAPVTRGDLTVEGALMGTPAYMAPEQARGAEVDARADVYALGAMLYHLLGGCMPYADSKSIDELLSSLRAGPPRPLPELDADLPSDLVAIVGKAMAHDPAARYETAGALAEDLRRWSTGQLVTAHDYSTRQLVRRWIGRHKATVLVAAAALVAMIAGGTYAYLEVRDERDTARAERDAKESARAEAEQARARVEATQAGMHEALGRRELEAGRHLRALAYLAEAARRRGDLGPALRRLIGRAAEPLAPLRWMTAADGMLIIVISVSDDSQKVLHATNAELLGKRAATLEIHRVTDGHLLVRIVPDFFAIDAALSGDGRWVAACGQQLAIWPASGGTPVLQVGSGIDTLDLEFAPDGSRLATGNDAGEVAIWTPDSQQPLIRWRAHDGAVHRVSWVPGGRELLTAGLDGRVRIWNVATGARRLDLPGQEDTMSPRYSRDGSLVLLVDVNGESARVHRIADGGVVVRLAPALDPSGGGIKEAIMDSRATRALTTGTDASAILWELPSGRRLAELPGHVKGSPVFARLSPDDHTLVTSDGRGSVRLWDAETGAARGPLQMIDDGGGDVAFSPDGKTLFGGSYRGRLHAWDPTAAVTGAVLAGHGAQARRIAYAAGGASVVTASRDGALHVWDSRSGRRLRRIDHAHAGVIRWLATSPDGARVATGGEDGAVRVWDLASGAATRVLAGHGATVVVALWLPDGQHLVAAAEDGRMHVWDTATGTRTCTTDTPGIPLFGAALSPDGELMVGASAGRRSALWSTRDCRLRHWIDTGHDATVRVAFAPDGSRVVLGGHDKQAGRGALLLDTRTGALQPVPGVAKLAAGVAFSADGALLAIGEARGAVHLFDTRTLTRKASMEESGVMVTTVAFDAAGEVLIAADADGVVRVWDVASASTLWSFQDQADGIYSISIRPDGAQIATAGVSTRAGLWNLPRWPGSMADLEQLVGCHVPWQVEGGLLVDRIPPNCVPGAPWVQSAR